MKYSKVLFVVTEKHMFTNYSLLDILIKKKVNNYKIIYIPELDYSTLFSRILFGRHKLLKLREYVLNTITSSYLNDTLIIYSNAEGFLLSNKHIWMPKLNNCKEVLLQHGIMPLNDKFKLFRFLLKPLSYILGYNIIGNGFGGIKANNIIVFGEKYANYLATNKNWEKERVISSTKILKPYTDIVENTTSNKNCLFLLQDLSKGYMNRQEMLEYIKIITNLLSFNYDKVILRKHPKMEFELTEIEIKENVYISNNELKNDILSVNRVYSFFSSALIDASLLGKEIVAIKLPEISSALYNSFNRIININELNYYLTSYSQIDKDATLNNEYYDMISSPEKVVDFILNTK